MNDHLLPKPEAMRMINARYIAQGKPPPYTDAMINGIAVRAPVSNDDDASYTEESYEPTPGFVPRQAQPPQIVSVAQRQPVQAGNPEAARTMQAGIPQQQTVPQVAQGPASGGPSQVPQIPGAGQKIAEIKKRMEDGTATVEDAYTLRQLQQQEQGAREYPPGYGDMGMARAGLAGMSNPGYEDMSQYGTQIMPSLLSMLMNLGGRR
jgi:hypothetical protein